jgi:hypothetical protein
MLQNRKHLVNPSVADEMKKIHVRAVGDAVVVGATAAVAVNEQKTKARRSSKTPSIGTQKSTLISMLPRDRIAPEVSCPVATLPVAMPHDAMTVGLVATAHEMASGNHGARNHDETSPDVMKQGATSHGVMKHDETCQYAVKLVLKKPRVVKAAKIDVVADEASGSSWRYQKPKFVADATNCPASEKLASPMMMTCSAMMRQPQICSLIQTRKRWMPPLGLDDVAVAVDEVEVARERVKNERVKNERRAREREPSELRENESRLMIADMLSGDIPTEGIPNVPLSREADLKKNCRSK